MSFGHRNKLNWIKPSLNIVLYSCTTLLSFQPNLFIEAEACAVSLYRRSTDIPALSLCTGPPQTSLWLAKLLNHLGLTLQSHGNVCIYTASSKNMIKLPPGPHHQRRSGGDESVLCRNSIFPPESAEPRLHRAVSDLACENHLTVTKASMVWLSVERIMVGEESSFDRK